jgi:hypothetical protein
LRAPWCRCHPLPAAAACAGAPTIGTGGVELAALSDGEPPLRLLLAPLAAEQLALNMMMALAELEAEQ